MARWATGPLLPTRSAARQIRSAGRRRGWRGSLQALDDLADEGGGLARRLADADAGLLQGFLLGLGGAGGAGDDGAGVAHRLALGPGEARDVADDRLGDVLLDERRGAFLGVAADLADHDDGGGLRVVLEGGEAV